MTIYAVVNEKIRDEFEKTYHVPYGYSNCPIFYSLKEAMFFFDDVRGREQGLIIERCESGSRQRVYE